jgi:hypothetical protein
MEYRPIGGRNGRLSGPTRIQPTLVTRPQTLDSFVDDVTVDRWLKSRTNPAEFARDVCGFFFYDGVPNTKRTNSSAVQRYSSHASIRIDFATRIVEIGSDRIYELIDACSSAPIFHAVGITTTISTHPTCRFDLVRTLIGK